MNMKIRKILGVLLIALIILSIGTTVHAGLGYVNPDNYITTPSLDSAGETVEMAQKIIGIINVIGTIIFIVTVILLGIKYMIGSTEQRAEYKNTMIPIFIGAFMLFSITSILNITYNLVKNIESNDKGSMQQKSQYEQGYNEAIQWLRNTCQSDEMYNTQLSQYEPGARRGEEYPSGYYQGLKEGPKPWKQNNANRGDQDAISFIKNCKSESEYLIELTNANQKARMANGTDAEYLNAYYNGLIKYKETYKTW